MHTITEHEHRSRPNAATSPLAPVSCKGCQRFVLAADLASQEHGLCSACNKLREKWVPAVAAPKAIGTSHPRAFTPADMGIIRRLHRAIPAHQLLEILNERLIGDLGPGAACYTLEQLRATVAELGAKGADGAAGGWSSMRKLLAEARRTGVLDRINEQVINDFAVVFSLNAKQVLQLKDVVLEARR